VVSSSISTLTIAAKAAHVERCGVHFPRLMSDAYAFEHPAASTMALRGGGPVSARAGEENSAFPQARSSGNQNQATAILTRFERCFASTAAA
jgi:hypothetical protein